MLSAPMIPNVHQWLLYHPMTRDIVVGITSSLIATFIFVNWKLLVSFCKIPPQRLGVWWRKARLDAALSRKRQMRSAHDDLYVALSIYVSGLSLLLLLVGFMVFTAGLIVVSNTKPSVDPRLITPWFLEGRLAQYLGVIAPMYVLMFCAWALTRFNKFMRHYDEQDAKLTIKITTLRAKLGLPTPEAPTNSPEEPVSPEFLSTSLREPNTQENINSGSLVRHPRYGEGRVLAVHGEAGNEQVAVQFEGYGLKQLVLRYAQLTLL